MSEASLSQSTTLETLVSSLDITPADSNQKEPILVDKVSGATLGKVVEWAEHHKDDVLLSDREKERQRQNSTPEKDVTFLRNLENME
ncbi:unnamed protein product [Caenorhabditis sp. 36 PRJEB53466]|nr:unnamed protein product [Caenorhabditis sp. 36 PRJEB53466]